MRSSAVLIVRVFRRLGGRWERCRRNGGGPLRIAGPMSSQSYGLMRYAMSRFTQLRNGPLPGSAARNASTARRQPSYVP